MKTIKTLIQEYEYAKWVEYICDNIWINESKNTQHFEDRLYNDLNVSNVLHDCDIIKTCKMRFLFFYNSKPLPVITCYNNFCADYTDDKRFLY